jgi:serine/threonine protein kinase
MNDILLLIKFFIQIDIVHRDLKLENILIKDSVDDVEYLDIKVNILNEFLEMINLFIDYGFRPK